SARKGGRILTVGNSAGPKLEFDNRYMFAKHLSLIGSTMSTRAEFATVMGLIFAGRLKPVLDRSFPVADIRAAHERLDAGETLGKITLTIGGAGQKGVPGPAAFDRRPRHSILAQSSQ